VVLASDPCRRLSYSWHTFTTDWAEHAGKSAEALATMAAERRSKVTFDLEKAGPAVRLTVTHDDFDPGSGVLADVSRGWPHVVSSLKSLLESGEPL
jgi:hypothetical protein